MHADAEMEAERPIGVFDSGIGGLSVLEALRNTLPLEDFVYFADSGHAPYGERDDAFVADRTATVASILIERHRIKLLVVACNTATAAAIQALRSRHPDLPVVGIEPALKPAASLSRTRRVAVFATRGTLASAKFGRLHDTLKQQVEFVRVPCDGLAGAIERGDEDAMKSLCERYVAAAGAFGDLEGQIDTLVLGCTHYPFVADRLRQLTGPRVHFIDTGAPVARQARLLLERDGMLRLRGRGSLSLLCSAEPDSLDAAARRWLSLPVDHAALTVPQPSSATA